MAESLRRRLGLTAVMAVVMGDMLGSGIFFTPGELARVATRPWQVYFMWTLCGLIVLAGALTLSELATLFPRAGATYHIISEAFGPLWGFIKAWMEAWVSAPGSIAGIAVVFGQYVQIFTSADGVPGSPQLWGLGAIWTFALINLSGVRWGGRTQIALTGVKLAGLLALVGGSFLLAEAAPRDAAATAAVAGETGALAFLRFLGLGVAAVFFTYDGWLDVSHVAGEVDSPKRNLPLGLGLGVLGILVVYLLVNVAFLRVMPLESMREAGSTVATTLASATFGEVGGQLVSGFIMVSIFGALGGLVMTAPRIVYAPAADYADKAPPESGLRRVLEILSYVSPRTGAPSAAILFCAVLSTVAVLFFGTFDRLVAFIFVPLQLTNVLVVAAVFRFRQRPRAPDAYRAPGYPVVPLVFMCVMTALMLNTLYFDPLNTLYGVALTSLGAPVYFWIRARSARRT